MYCADTEFLGMPYIEATVFWFILSCVTAFFWLKEGFKEVLLSKKECDLLDMKNRINKIEEKEDKNGDN